MSIIDETGQTPSITKEDRALALFTDRYSLIRAFTQTLHEDDALGKILFFHGGGGNGKSLLLRFLREHGCKRFHRWDELRRQPDAAFVRQLRGDRAFDPVPVARLDFHAPPREFEQPTVDYDALLMLRRQLGAFSAPGVSRLRFPVYDFAAVWYLHRTNRLTDNRLMALFPNEEINFVLALAGEIRNIPFAGLAQAVLGLFDKHLKQWWTLFRHRRGVDRALIEELEGMDPEDLVKEMPRLFALDLNASLAAGDTPSRIVLLFDGHDALAAGSEGFRARLDDDRWLRYLLAHLDLTGGVVPVVAGRKPPRWPEQAECTIPARYLESCLVGHFSDADADAYLERAGVQDPALRARLCDYARVGPDEVHPLFAGLGADVVLQAVRGGSHLTAGDFPEEPDAGKKREELMKRLLMLAGKDVEYAVRSLAAARAFDRDLFETLGEQGRSCYTANDAAFDTLTGFSFVWEDEVRGTGWYSVHALLRRVLREYSDDRLRDADAALEEIYRERAGAGDPLALAEAIYHAYRQAPERGLEEWATAFEEARNQSRYALCEALRTVGEEFRPEEPWWQARMAQEEGDYLLVRSRYAEADEALQASVQGYEKALCLAPDDPAMHNNKGNALQRRGDLLAALARHEEAEQTYADAVAAYEEALRRAPDFISVHFNKALALLSWGQYVQSLGQDEAARARWEAAKVHVGRVLDLAPQLDQAERLLAVIRQRLDSLDAGSSQEE